MKRKAKIFKMILVAICLSLFSGYTSYDKIQQQKVLNSSDVTLITRVLPYGEVGYAIACDFGSSVDSSKLSKSSFKVKSIVGDKSEERTITKVYTNNVAETSNTLKTGRYVIIELDSNDANASTLTYDNKREQNTRNELKYYITQNEDVETINHVKFAAAKEKILAGKEVTPIVDDFKKLVYEDSKDNRLDYRLFEPKVKLNEKYPLVLFLHGSGECGSDNTTQLLANKGAIAFADPKQQQKNPCYVLAPQAPFNQKPSSYWCEEPMKSVLLNLLEETIKKYPIDTKRIYITGLSNGGDGTWGLIEKNPKFFAAAIPVCGLSNSNYDISKVPAYIAIDPSQAEAVKNIPIWVFHAADDPAVDVRNSREIVEAIKKAGGTSVKYTEYEAGTIKPIGHFAWVNTYENTKVMDWLFKQSIK